jgi:putative flippase GtrA
MSRLYRQPEKSLLLRQLARFVCSGLVSTLTHVVVALSAIEILLFSSVIANLCGYVLATSVSYCLHTAWSFSRQLQRTYFSRFIVVSLLGGAEAVLLAAVCEISGLPSVAGTLVVVVCVSITTFLGHRNWTYR